MAARDLKKRLAEAAEQLNRHEKRQDGDAVVASLSEGLTILRNSLYLRVHHDVEKIVGKDSMLMPLSEVENRHRTEEEIDVYQIAESAATIAYFGYVDTSDDWHVSWLARLRLGDEAAGAAVAQRLGDYLSEGPDERRLAFTDVLAKVLPESRQAPLVLFRLLPLSVRIATAMAFGDRAGASDLRSGQIAHLPVIADCRECHGGVLENGRQCPKCGNPLWTSEWLLTTD